MSATVSQVKGERFIGDASSQFIANRHTVKIITELMLIGYKNLNQKFEEFPLNRSRELHVFP